jgi:hypothetical protein
MVSGVGNRHIYAPNLRDTTLEAAAKSLWRSVRARLTVPFRHVKMGLGSLPGLAIIILRAPQTKIR